MALKNVGKHLIQLVVAETDSKADFRSLYDFCKRMGSHGPEVNRRAIESFIKSGAFDRLEKNRRAMSLSLDGILKSVEKDRKNNVDGQLNLFDTMQSTQDIPQYHMQQCEEFSKDVLLQQEKEVSGLFLSGHPLDKYKDVIRSHASTQILRLMEENHEKIDGTPVSLVCIIVKVKYHTTKNNDMMSFCEVEDLSGSMEVVVFPKVLMAAGDLVQENSPVIITGRISCKEDDAPKILADKIISANHDKQAQTQGKDQGKNVRLYIRVPSKDSPQYQKAQSLFQIYEGTVPVFIRFTDSGQMLKAPQQMWTLNNKTLIHELKDLLGADNVALRESLEL